VSTAARTEGDMRIRTAGDDDDNDDDDDDDDDDGARD
jgi:hypothetical protein